VAKVETLVADVLESDTISIVHRGACPRAEQEALSRYGDAVLLDHEWVDLGAYKNMSDFASRCQTALKRAIWQEEHNLSPYLYADPLNDVRVAERASDQDPRIVYFISASRSISAIMVSRLLLALYHPSHLFLIHIDLKTDAAAYDQLIALTTKHPNIRALSTRRLVQWGAWTMVVTMLDAIKSVVDRMLDFDFFINLSDVDVSLRTNDEIVAFLRQYKGRQFVQVHQGSGEWLERARNFTGAHAVVECGGYGYVAVNSSPIDLGGGQRVCCFGRGGPVVYANETRLHLRELREAQAAEARAAEAQAVATQAAALGDAAAAAASVEPHLYTGSQWVILDRGFCTYLVNDPAAKRWTRIFERRFLSDESFVQTVLMHSPYKQTLINANMRWIFWPHYHGDPTSYWLRMGMSFVGGPTVVNASEAPGVFHSPYMFARKFDPGVDSEPVRLWDEWMAKKLKGEPDELQEPLGGRPKAAARDASSGTHGPPEAIPTRAQQPARVVRSIVFDDGSSCDCGVLCYQNDNCCTDWVELCPNHTAAGDLPPPPCPLPSDPPLRSAASPGEAVKLTFVNFARFPVKIFFLSLKASPPAEVAILEGGGATATFDTAEGHAWAARSFSGVTVMELPAHTSRPPRDTIEIEECDLSTAGRTLHSGWK